MNPKKTSIGAIIIWLSGLLLSCFLTGFLFLIGGAGASEGPSANLKIRVPSGKTTEQTFELAEKIILSHGYRQGESLSEGWSYTLEYKKDKFSISYAPNDDAQVELRVIYIYFYEQSSEGSLFSEAGIAEYDALAKALGFAGLKLLSEDQADRDNFRWAATPEMFNNRRIPELSQERIISRLFIGSAFALYGFLIIWPALWIFLRLLSYLTLPSWVKRLLFIVGSTLLLPPGFILLTPFGPAILAPLPLALPFALLATPLLYPLVLSIICTLIVASVASLRIRDPDISKVENVKLET
jgi:hypothetical protein